MHVMYECDLEKCIILSFNYDSLRSKLYIREEACTQKIVLMRKMKTYDESK